MLSREDQRRFDQITRELRAADPKFFTRLDNRARLHRHRFLIAVAILLWVAVPLAGFAGGWGATPLCLVLSAVAAGITWRIRRRW